MTLLQLLGLRHRRYTAPLAWQFQETAPHRKYLLTDPGWKCGAGARVYAIPGGSEEIMLDLAVRQAIKTAKL